MFASEHIDTVVNVKLRAMDYIILGFLAISILVIIVFKMKLAITDAGTPKYGGAYPSGEGTGQQGNLDNRFGLSSLFFLIIGFGAILLFINMMVGAGHDPHRNYDNIKEVIFERNNEQPGLFDKQNRNNLRKLPDGTMTVGSVEVDKETHEKFGAPINDRTNRTTNQNQVRPDAAPGFMIVDGKTPEGGGYSLQVSSSSNPQNAHSKAEKINQANWSVKTTVVEIAGKYKVRIGPFKSKEDAIVFRRTKLEKADRNSFIVEN